MAGNSSFDALLSTTLKNYTPRIEDNIFSNLTLLYWLKEAGHIEKVSGGEQIVEPLMYAANGTTGSYGGYDNIPTTPQEGITSAVYDWKQYAVSIAISGIEEAKNRGESQVISLLKAKIDQAEMSLQDAMNTMLYGDGTGNSSKDWLGLKNFVGLIGDAADSYANATNNTVGGITTNTTDNAWWRNRSVSAGTDQTAPFDSTEDKTLLGSMSRIYNLCTKGKIKPEFVLTSQAVWERYESALQPQLRYQSTKSADAGFENLLYKSAPVMWDEDIAGNSTLNATNTASGNVAYFLNSKFLKLKVHSDVWMKATPMEKPHGQDARYSQILSYGNLTCNNRRFQGLLYGIDVA